MAFFQVVFSYQQTNLKKKKKIRETKLQLLTFFIECKQTADDDSFLPLNPANALASGSVSLRIPEKEKGEKIT